MKKMIVFALMAMVVGFVQAVTCDWAIVGNSFAKSGDDNTGNARARDYTVLVFLASDQSAVQTALDNGQWETVLSLAQGDLKKTSATGAVNGDFEGSFGATVSIFAVVFDTFGTRGTIDNSSNYLMSGTVAATTYTPPSPGTQANFPGLNNPWTAWTPVPEPTSMALLALGAAAFGLRRRFRK